MNRSIVRDHQADDEGCRSCGSPAGQMHSYGCSADPRQIGRDADDDPPGRIAVRARQGETVRVEIDHGDGRGFVEVALDHETAHTIEVEQ